MDVVRAPCFPWCSIAIWTRPANLPVSRYLADPSLVYPYRQGKAGLSYDQAIGQRWTFRSYERSSTGWANYNARVANALSKDQQTVTLNDLETDQYFQAHTTGSMNLLER
jgi:iron complex outermembrane receptor protein